VLDQKVERSEITHKLLPELSAKLDRKDLDIFHKYLDEHKIATENKFQSHLAEIETFLAKFKDDIEAYVGKLSSSIGKKADYQEL
jgi:hypothetical protein